MDYRCVAEKLIEAPTEIGTAERARLVFALLLSRFCDERLPHAGPSGASCSGSALLRLFALRNRLLHTELFCAGGISCPGLERARDLVQSLDIELNVETLARLYEPLFSSAGAKREGVFYTPRELVSRIVGMALARRPERPLILDPACGSGLFLLAAFAALRGAQGFAASRDILQSCIFGCDKDAHAAAAARLLLLLSLAETAGERIAELPCLKSGIPAANGLFDADDLTGEIEEGGIVPLSWNRRFPAAAVRGGFDCVIGNPPYGLKRGEQLSERENALLKARYADFRNGKVNKYLAFMARGYELLSPAGRMCMVVPNAWLGINGGSALRRHLLQERALAEVIVFERQVFPEARVEAVVFCAEKGAQHGEILVQRAADAAAPAGFSFRISASRCLKSADARIPAIWSERAEPLFELLDACPRLGDPGSPYMPLIALQAYAVGKGSPPQTADDVRSHIYHHTAKAHPESHPYLEGADVRRYSCAWSGAYLRHGPWLAEPQRLDRFEGPRVLVREILGPLPRLLIAAFVDSCCLYNKSVLHVIAAPHGSREAMLALLAILNSTLASLVIALRGRKSQRRLFPKIVNEDLKDFPLPEDPAGHVRRLAELAEKRSKAGDDDRRAKNLEDEIETAVFEAYGFDQRFRGEALAALDEVKDCLVRGKS